MVKDASTDIEKLLHALTSLIGVLTAIQAIVYRNLEEYFESTNSRLSSLKGPLDNCKNALDEVKVKLKKACPDSRQSLARATRILSWQVKELSSLRRDRIQMAINNLPQSLYDTYKRILSGVKDVDRMVAKRALMWLAFSARLITLTELAEAVTVNPGTLIIGPEARWNPVDLLSVIGSLGIYSKEDSITLAHHSIKDYLLSTDLSTACPGFALCEFTSNIEIAETCLTYLFIQDFSRGACLQEHHNKSLDKYWQRCKDYPLLRYASSFWPLHSRKHFQNTPTLDSLTCSLINHTKTGYF